MQRKVLVCTTVFGEEATKLCALYDCVIPDHELEVHEIIAQANSLRPDALVICRIPFGADILNQLPDTVKIIATVSVGYDHIDLQCCKARGISVANTPNVLTDCTADVGVLLLLLSVERASNFALANANLDATNDGRSAPWKYSVHGRTLGIIGMGKIGRSIGTKMAGMGMKVLYHNRNPLSPELEQLGNNCTAQYCETIEELIKNADILSINCPAAPKTTPQTILLSAERIRRLKKNSIVVNTARGSLVDESALIQALKTGDVAAAGLDVFQIEPTPRESPLITMKQVACFPHVGSSTIETRQEMMLKALTNVHQFFKNETPTDLVSLQ